VIFSSLPEPPDVEAVALGPDGLIAGMKPGAAYFDLSTNSPSSVKKLHAAFAEKGAHMLDAPVSGGPAGAASRKLAIWVGGDETSSTSTRRRGHLPHHGSWRRRNRAHEPNMPGRCRHSPAGAACDLCRI
jgi:3-hydroxyisobutyrate dehydrogenase-like beta-hydroxyacid dehydrogenase